MRKGGASPATCCPEVFPFLAAERPASGLNGLVSACRRVP